MAEQPSLRDVIGDDLLSEFLKLKDSKENAEIIQQTPNKTIRCVQMPDNDCLTIVEMTSAVASTA